MRKPTRPVTAMGMPKQRPTRRWMRALTIILIVSSIVIEWLFLTGTPPSSEALAEAFLPAAPEAAVLYTRPNFQTGVIFPRWGGDAYTTGDRNYAIGLDEIQQQTGARWIELTVNLRQDTYDTTIVTADSLSTTPASLAEGIRAAHAHGYKVFIEPLLSIDQPAPNGSRWAGAVTFPRGSANFTAWFESYWEALEPYFQAAQRTGAEQMAIGTELADLEGASPNYWYWLIQQARNVYSGRLTYDMNFTSLSLPVREWMRTPSLSSIGVSLYTTLAGANERVPLASIPERWAAIVGTRLDTFAIALRKPLFISEVGYRNNSDAMFKPYLQTSDAPHDPKLQAALYDAALMFALSDHHITGIYFWAWSLPPFSPNWLPAARVLKSWYHSPLA